MAPIKCFFLTPTDQVELELRRYDGTKCSAKWGYHNASVVIGRAAQADHPSGGDLFPHDDPRWPTTCTCGHEFGPGDYWQFNADTLYSRSDNGELVTLRNAPVGAMWFAPWLSECPEWRGPDGNTLVVMCPGRREWVVDSRCSNCTLPNDDVHKCWVRHGVPPNVHVDKNGVTCSAGGGSIAVPGWHGFLTNGALQEER
jgi:hypothetical protein